MNQEIVLRVILFVGLFLTGITLLGCFWGLLHNGDRDR